MTTSVWIGEENDVNLKYRQKQIIWIYVKGTTLSIFDNTTLIINAFLNSTRERVIRILNSLFNDLRFIKKLFCNFEHILTILDILHIIVYLFFDVRPNIFNRAQVRAMRWPIQDVYLLLVQPIDCVLGFMTTGIIMLKDWILIDNCFKLFKECLQNINISLRR